MSVIEPLGELLAEFFSKAEAESVLEALRAARVDTVEKLLAASDAVLRDEVGLGLGDRLRLRNALENLEGNPPQTLDFDEPSPRPGRTPWGPQSHVEQQMTHMHPLENENAGAVGDHGVITPDSAIAEFVLKALVVGDVGTGKMCFMQRVYNNTFDGTSGGLHGFCDFILHEIQWNPTTRIKLQVWGIGGQQRFAHLTRVYYREARGAFVLYDMSRPKTLAGALKWKQDIDGKVTLPNGDDIPCVLLATKCDQAVDAPLDLEDFARENGFIAVYRTSAKLGEGVGEAVNELVRQMVATEEIDIFRAIEDLTHGGREGLDLNGKSLGNASEAVMVRLGGALAGNIAVKTLHLTNNQLGSATESVMAQLAMALATNTSVTDLSLSSNRLGTATESVFAHLAEAIAKNSSVVSLNLSDNDLGSAREPVMARFGEALAQNVSIKRLFLRDNQLSSLSWLIEPSIPRAGADSIALEFLHLAGNALAEFPSGLCPAFPELKLLEFSKEKTGPLLPKGDQTAPVLRFPREFIQELPLECLVRLPVTTESFVAGRLSTDPDFLISPLAKNLRTTVTVANIARAVLSSGGGSEAEWRRALNVNDSSFISLDGVTHIGAKSLAQALTTFSNIKHLSLRHSTPTADSLGDSGLQALSAFLGDTFVTRLDLFGNSFGNDALHFLGQALLNSKTLTTLDIGGNKKLTSLEGLLPDSAGSFLLKQLGVSHSVLAVFPSSLCTYLPELEELNLGKSSTLVLPWEIEQLPSDCKIDLTMCTSVSIASRDNLKPVDLPKEYLGVKTIAEVVLFPVYGAGKMIAPTQLRLMIVGNAEAGKTTLVEALLETRTILGDMVRIFQGTKRRPVTFGVDVVEWIIGDQLKFSCWDFAGQIQYHSAHKSFLSSDALFLLVFNAACAVQQSLDQAMRYVETWLNLLASYAPGAQVVIVGTNTRTRRGDVVPELVKGHEMREHLEERVAALISRAPRVRIHEQMLLVDALHHVNCTDLRDICEEQAYKLLKEREWLPAEIFRLGQVVKKASVSMPIMRFADFEGLLRKVSSLPDGFSRYDLFAQAMHQWGWVVRFDHILDGVIVLDPQWLAKCLACVVDGLEPRPRAVVTRQDLEAVWQTRARSIRGCSRNDQKFFVNTLIEIMKSFDLAFVRSVLAEAGFVPDEFLEFVLPSLLPVERPLVSTVNAESILRGAPRAVSRRYTFPIFPSGLLSQLFVRLHTLPHAILTGWREGLWVEFRLDNGFSGAVCAELINDFVIQVRASVGEALLPFERCLVTLACELVQRDDTGSNLIVVERDGEGMAIDPISGDVISTTLEPVEFLADADIVVGPNIASGQFGEVVQVRTTTTNPQLPANAVFAMKRSKLGAKQEAYDVEFEVMKRVQNCGNLVGIVAYQRAMGDDSFAKHRGKKELSNSAEEGEGGRSTVVCLLMPLFDSSLSFVLKNRFESLDDGLGWYSTKEITGWLLQICHGMRYLHAKGYAHLDLKTRNVMVRFRGSSTVESLAVGDFGEAIFVGLEDDNGRASSVSRIPGKLTLVKGSIGHQAPEILAASPSSPVQGAALFKADVFSFGIVASVCMSGIAIGEMLGDEGRTPRAGASVRPPVNDTVGWDDLRGLFDWCVEACWADRPTFAELSEGDLALPSPLRAAVSANNALCERREAGARTNQRDWKQRALRAEYQNVRMRDQLRMSEERASSSEERALRAEAELQKALQRLRDATGFREHGDVDPGDKLRYTG